MFGKMQEMQEELQKKLKGIMVDGESGDGKVKVLANASQQVVNITIAPELLGIDNAEELEDLLIVAINRAMHEAQIKAGEESQNMMSGLLPPGMDMGGLFG